MKEGALVKSVENLSELEASLAVFAGRVQELLQETKMVLQRKNKQLQERYNYWKKQRNYWLGVKADSDDRDEISWIENKIDEAEENLRQIAYWQNRIKEAEKQYRHQKRVLGRIVEVETPRARSFLRESVEQLEKYLNLQVGLISESARKSETSGGRRSPQVKTETNRGRYNDSVLPGDFCWVSLSSIKMDEINDGLAFKKVSYEEMKDGLQRLRSRIIPALAENDNRDKEYFREQDKEAGLSYPEGQQRIYEAFFGGDHIRLEKVRGAEKYSITNGRHRIKVAKDLGWEAIPARAVEVDL